MLRFIQKYIGLLFLVIAALLITWLMSSDTEDESTYKEDRLPQVTILTLSPELNPVPILGQGIIRAHWQSTLTSDISGRVTYINPALNKGGQFDQGEVLVTLDDHRYQVELAEAKSRLAETQQALAEEERQAKRAEENWQLSTLSGDASDLLLRRPQLKSARLQVKAAKAALARAQYNLNNLNLTAPYTGATITRHINLGDYLGPEANIADIYSDRELEAELTISETEFALLSKDQPTLLLIGKNQEPWPAHLAHKTKVLDEASQTITVIAALSASSSNRELPLLGQYVEAEFKSDALNNVIRIPQSCISGDKDIWYVDSNRRLQRLKHRYLSQSQEIIYLQVTDSKVLPSYDIACYPSKQFFSGMAVNILNNKDEVKHDKQ